MTSPFFSQALATGERSWHRSEPRDTARRICQSYEDAFGSPKRLAKKKNTQNNGHSFDGPTKYCSRLKSSFQGSFAGGESHGALRFGKSVASFAYRGTILSLA
jgi:hypothetical protein